MTADELVAMILANSPIEPMDEYNECRWCRSVWAEESYEEWLKRHGAATRPDWLTKHHDDDCLWVLANQVQRS